MTLSKKVSLSLVSMAAVVSLAACSANTPTSAPGVDLKSESLSQLKFKQIVANLNARGETPQVIDMGDKKGTTFAVKINLDNPNTFQTKVQVAPDPNEPGHRYTSSDITKVNVFLFASATTSYSGDTLTVDPDFNGGSPVNLAKTGSSITVLFTNVPGRANPWRVAVAAMGGNNGIPDTTNITDDSGNYGDLDDADDFYAVSSSGGDSDGGSVLIDETTLALTNNGTAALEVDLTLIEADGATINSVTTVNDGSSTPTADIAAE